MNGNHRRNALLQAAGGNAGAKRNGFGFVGRMFHGVYLWLCGVYNCIAFVVKRQYKKVGGGVGGAAGGG